MSREFWLKRLAVQAHIVSFKEAGYRAVHYEMIESFGAVERVSLDLGAKSPDIGIDFLTACAHRNGDAVVGPQEIDRRRFTRLLNRPAGKRKRSNGSFQNGVIEAV